MAVNLVPLHCSLVLVVEKYVIDVNIHSMEPQEVLDDFLMMAAVHCYMLHVDYIWIDCHVEYDQFVDSVMMSFADDMKMQGLDYSVDVEDVFEVDLDLDRGHNVIEAEDCYVVDDSLVMVVDNDLVDVMVVVVILAVTEAVDDDEVVVDNVQMDDVIVIVIVMKVEDHHSYYYNYYIAHYH